MCFACCLLCLVYVLLFVACCLHVCLCLFGVVRLLCVVACCSLLVVLSTVVCLWLIVVSCSVCDVGCVCFLWLLRVLLLLVGGCLLDACLRFGVFVSSLCLKHV